MQDKEKISAILSVVLTAVIALLAVFGYHVVIVQPQVAAMQASLQAALAAAAARVEAGASASGLVVVPSLPGAGCFEVCIQPARSAE